MPKLAVEGLKVTYGPIVGTEGVGFELEAGETLALVGANGAGKSSTLKAILGMPVFTNRPILSAQRIAVSDFSIRRVVAGKLDGDSPKLIV